MVASIRKEPLYIWVGMWCREWFGREWQVKFRSKAQQQAPIIVPVPLDCHSVSSSILSSRPCAHGGQVPCPPPLVSQCLVRWTEWEANIILVKECQVSISKSQSHTCVDHPQGLWNPQVTIVGLIFQGMGALYSTPSIASTVFSVQQ